MEPTSSRSGTERGPLDGPAYDVVSRSAWALLGVRFISSAAFLIAGMVMVGWVMKRPAVTSLIPGLPSMKFNTALSLGFLSTGLFALTILHRGETTARRRRWILQATAGAALLIAALTIVQMLLGVSLGIDELIIADFTSTSENPGKTPGQMSQATAGSIVLLGLALLMSSSRRYSSGAPSPASLAAVSAAAIGALAGMSMLTTRQDLAGLPFFSTMALHTAWLVFLLGAGTILTLRARNVLELRSAHQHETRGGALLIALVALVFACGIGLTELVSNRSAKRELEIAQARFDRLTERVIAEAKRRVYLPVYGLKGARGMYAGSDHVSRLEFREYVNSRDFPVEFPGTIGMGFIKRVPRAELDSFLAAERADDAPGYTLRTSGDHDPLYPIVYIDPLEDNVPAWGYDVGSESSRRASVDHAIRTGEPTLTPPLTLVQDEYKRAGFLFLVPVYDINLPANTPDQRLNALVGLVYSAMVIDEIFTGVASVAEGGLAYRVFVGNEVADDSELYQDVPAGFALDARSGPAPRFSSTNRVETGGQTWTIHTMSTKEFEATTVATQGPLIAFYGLGLSSIGACFVWVFGRSRARAVELANSMTIDLKEHADELSRSADLISQKNDELLVLADRAHRVVDDVSHEFRTPLTVIKEFTSIIADGLAGPVSEEQAGFLRIVDVSASELNHMVEDLLDSSKLRAGLLRVCRREHHVADIFASLRLGMSRKAACRSIAIEEDIEPGLPTVFVDDEKIRRIISNLITNAIKFSPEGGTIRLIAARGDTPGRVVLSVRDDGPGLSEEDVDQLFGRFRQVSTSRNVAAKGFGLGLSIAQELAWLNLGSLSVESVKGEGATFTLTLPEYTREAVLSSYERTIESGDQLGESLAVLRVDIGDKDGSERNWDGLETKSFLASVTFPTDLIMPLEFAGPVSSHQSWWIMGRTANVNAWITRLNECHENLVEENPLNVAPLSIDIRGVWEYPDDARAAFELLGKTPGSQHAHAA